MKALKIVSVIIFMIGMILIIGAVGEDDFYIMELHQAHEMAWNQIILGMAMVLQLALVEYVGQRNA